MDSILMSSDIIQATLSPHQTHPTFSQILSDIEGLGPRNGTGTKWIGAGYTAYGAPKRLCKMVHEKA